MLPPEVGRAFGYPREFPEPLAGLCPPLFEMLGEDGPDDGREASPFLSRDRLQGIVKP